MSARAPLAWLLLLPALAAACAAPAPSHGNPDELLTARGRYTVSARANLATRILPWGLVDQYLESIRAQEEAVVLGAERAVRRDGFDLGWVAWRDPEGERLMLLACAPDHERHVLVQGRCLDGAWPFELEELLRRVRANVKCASRAAAECGS